MLDIKNEILANEHTETEKSQLTNVFALNTENNFLAYSCFQLKNNDQYNFKHFVALGR